MAEPEGDKNRSWRKNVLAVLLMAYGSLLTIFFLLIWQDVEATTAFDLVGVPFMALIGGTLAIAKDLL